MQRIVICHNQYQFVGNNIFIVWIFYHVKKVKPFFSRWRPKIWFEPVTGQEQDAHVTYFNQSFRIEVWKYNDQNLWKRNLKSPALL